MTSTISESADCRTCLLRKGGFCTQLADEPCSDYRPVPIITQEERDSWPEIMDASYIRMFGAHRD